MSSDSSPTTYWNMPNAGMLLTETVNFLLGAAFFVRSVFKAILIYVNENKIPGTDHVKGTGLGQSLPEDLPSILEIRRALPKHCFESSITQSMYHVVKDFVQVFLAFLVLSYLEGIVDSFPLRSLLVLLYWAVQGTFFFALFLLAHDCAHGSFSNYNLLNDVVGTILLGFLLVPYCQWKLNHDNHHRNTGNLDRDEVFYLVRRCKRSEAKTLPAFALGFGWFLYFALGHSARHVKHFSPLDPMLLRHTVGCIFSLAGLGLMIILSYKFYIAYGFGVLMVYYLMPVFVMGSFIVVVTFLQHSEINIPWYTDDKWYFVKGQLSTIDWNYGIVHHVIHSIGTHQMHHMFAKIPHYHLEEATKHFRQAFPSLVRSCDEPILPSLVRMFKVYEKQSVIEDDAKQVVYK